jgi:hypothetical protein
VFNNADGFAMAFSDAWQGLGDQQAGGEVSREQKLEMVLELLAEHPFLMASPDQARQVADFRMRLLDY